ncbi:MAG: sigma-70 family RNA polymerase sigma factor [Ilumatobacteraceae bacterium]
MAAPRDDAELVRAAQGGDRDALDQLFRRHYDRVHAVCRRITGNEADAADAAQEAMIAMVRGLGRFDGRASFGTWAYRIATNASLDELRRRRRRPMVAGPQHGDGHDRATDLLERADPTAGQRVEQLGDRYQLDAALAALPEDFRVPVVLRDVGDLDYAEIAAALDVPVGTVKSRIARGRALLAGTISSADGNRDGASDRPTSDPRADHNRHDDHDHHVPGAQNDSP